ncbi:crossover junction endodeoxyribonuclease RuvC [Candidatus Peregrinibacteria bacterium]|nr:MAG: crossover junction endodeoxyribonuclease RuvC [Candidatus Peregrinibacteria bacterium]
MKILGIDPGLATIGFALLEENKILDYGVFKTESGHPLADRLVQIGDDIRTLLAEFRPDCAFIEKLFFVQNVTNGMAVAHSRGVLLEALAREGIPTDEISPKDVKIAVCGYGNADKKQVQHAIARIFRLSELPRPDDAADAIAIAYAGYFLQKKILR